jgi:hypothetical protein
MPAAGAIPVLSALNLVFHYRVVMPQSSHGPISIGRDIKGGEEKGGGNADHEGPDGNMAWLMKDLFTQRIKEIHKPI